MAVIAMIGASGGRCVGNAGGTWNLHGAMTCRAINFHRTAAGGTFALIFPHSRLGIFSNQITQMILADIERGPAVRKSAHVLAFKHGPASIRQFQVWREAWNLSFVTFWR